MDTSQCAAWIEQNRRAYDALASNYSRAWSDYPDRGLVNAFVQLLPPGAQVLDLGCGPGHYSALLSNAGCRVQALDQSAAMVEEARRRNPGMRIRLGNMAALDEPEHSLDGLWVCASLPHIPGPLVPSVLRRFHRALRPRGVLFANAIVGALEHRFEAPEEMPEGLARFGRFFQWYPTPAAFCSLVESQGFEQIGGSERHITSDVIERAAIRTNRWVNAYFRAMKA